MKTNLIILLIWLGGLTTGTGIGMQVSVLFAKPDTGEYCMSTNDSPGKVFECLKQHNQEK